MVSPFLKTTSVQSSDSGGEKGLVIQTLMFIMHFLCVGSRALETVYEIRISPRQNVVGTIISYLSGDYNRCQDPLSSCPNRGKEAADGMCKTVGFSPVFPTKLQIVKTRLVFHNFHMIFNIRWRDLMGYPDFYRDLVKGRLWKFCRFPLNLQIV